MHLRRLVSLALAALAPGAGAQGNSTPVRNAAYLELLGNGGLFSLNYERLVSEHAAVRVAASNWSAGDLWGGTSAVTTALLMASHLNGEGSHKAELGAGILIGHRSAPPTSAGDFATLTGVIGYRYQSRSGGRVVRAGFTPFLGLTGGVSAYPDPGFLPSVGISLGYAF
jgi:hypothetical protein